MKIIENNINTFNLDQRRHQRSNNCYIHVWKRCLQACWVAEFQCIQLAYRILQYVQGLRGEAFHANTNYVVKTFLCYMI